MRQVSVLAVLGCVAAVSCGCGVNGSGAGGQVVSYQGYGGTAIVSSDGRTITVGQFGASCPAKVKAVARESATRVTLRLRFSIPRNPASCMNASAGIIPAQKIRLAAPLGSRTLADGKTGRATAWISARAVLRPRHLPPGYRLDELTPAVDLGRAQSPGPAGCTQIYQPPNSGSQLEIIQTAGTLRLPGLAQARGTPIRVRGHPGHATHTANRTVIRWREDGLTDYIISGVQNPQGSSQLLSGQQLIATAESAPQPVGSESGRTLTVGSVGRGRVGGHLAQDGEQGAGGVARA